MEHMFDRLKTAKREMDAALAELEPDAMVGGQPAACLELLSGHERAVAAARLRVTARAADMNHWQRQGFSSFEDWLAATFGTSYGQARRHARTARNLDQGADDTADALAVGQISEDEADTIADAADKNPAAEKDLLDTARNKGKSHQDLKRQAARAKAAGENDTERAKRLRRGRRAGWGIDREGFWTLSGRFEPHIGAEMKAVLAAEVDRLFTTARRNNTRDTHDHYRADAITNLLLGPNTTGGGTGTDSTNGAAAHALSLIHI